MRFKQFLLVMLIISQFTLAYRDHSFTLKAVIDGDGNAHIIQKSIFLSVNESERVAFDVHFSREQFTLSDWQRFSRTITYYFTGNVSNLTIIATREPSLGLDGGGVTLEYDVPNLMRLEKNNARSTQFTLDTNRTILFTNRNGELALGKDVELVFVLPTDAYSIKPVPEPQSKVNNELVWRGPLKGRFALSYFREKPLGQEVNDFFIQLQRDVGNLYLLALILALGGFLVFKYFNTRRD